MADWAGKTLGKVHIDQLIARGGMAEVYKGDHKTFGVVAIKVMRGLMERDPEQLSRFQREAEVVAELKHPNIVQMFDYKVEDDTPCLVMEYIPGPSLATYLKRLHEKKQRLPIGLVASLLKNIASALDYAHSKGIVHRDIKPANVLLRSASEEIRLDQPLPADVEPVLTDFGLVRLLDSTMHTTTGSVSGTPAYMSPEQARGEKVDKRTDIYSLGIMLYEMLAGGVPFQADTTFGMLMKHINEPPPPIDGVSSDLQAILDRTLAKDPSMRYESAGELANEFMAVFNGQTISPGTIHIAQLARQAAKETEKPKGASQESAFLRRFRIGIEVVIAIGLVVLLFQFFRPAAVDGNETPVAVVTDLNIPVGRLRFNDFNGVLDRVTIVLNNIALPSEGQRYEAWLKDSASGIFRNIGSIRFNSAKTGQVEFTAPDQQNLFGSFDEVLITIEQGEAAVTQPSSEVVFSSVFPPQAREAALNLLVTNPDTPDEYAPMQGLYYYSGSYIAGAINGDPINPNFVGLVQAYQNEDEATVRTRTEDVINLIVGEQSEQYKDYDQNGKLTKNDGDGYGSLPNGDRLGYLQLVTLGAKNVADAEDSTPNMRAYGEDMQTCVQNMKEWTNQLLPLALRLSEMPFGPEMEATINKMSELGEYLLQGFDADKDGLFEPIEGECGATLAYEYGWYLVDMPLFVGPDRIPSSGK
ncbi:MAG: serine/threonine-protein kinase [Anaerolineales bacterium]|nr:MAG: serine/threonine-protein kinase [Anaerolineales bacterium]